MPKECDELTVVEVPVVDIKVTDAKITSPANKTVYPGGAFTFTVGVHNYGSVAGDVNVKLTYDGTEFGGSPVTIIDVPAGADSIKGIGLIAPPNIGVHNICAEEV